MTHSWAMTRRHAFLRVIDQMRAATAPRLAPRDELVNTLKYEDQARAVLAPAVASLVTDRVDAGGGRVDRQPFDRITLRPRMLVPALDLDLTVTLFGDSIGAPIIVAPIANQRRFHADADSATITGASPAKAPVIISSEAMTKGKAGTIIWHGNVHATPEEEPGGSVGFRSPTTERRASGLILALTLAAAGLLPRAAAAQSANYDASREGDVVVLSDRKAEIVVRVLIPVSNALQMTVKGEDVIRKNWNTVDDIRQRPGLNGVPLLWPYANRLEEQAFYANGKKYTFDAGMGNTGANVIPIHGFLQNTNMWKLVEAKADAKSAWVTTKLEFFRTPAYMKQFPFAHTLTMTYRVQDGSLEVRTRIDSLSDEPIPVAIGFHPYFQLTDSPRDAWRLSVAAKTHWLLNESKLPTGATQPISAILPDPKNVMVKDVTLDDIFTDLERDANGRATMTLMGKTQQLDVVVGAKFKTILVLSRDNNANRLPATARGTVAFEPMAAVTNALNLAHRGTYKELQSIQPGGSWEESFWIRPRGF